MSVSWTRDLCGCGGPCLMSWCCPCIVLGKTQARLRNPHNADPDCCNGTCMAHCGLNALGGWGWILSCMQRGEIREKHGIEGSTFSDCCVSFCCHCCGINQQANELEERQHLVNNSGYKAQPGMRM